MCSGEDKAKSFMSLPRDTIILSQADLIYIILRAGMILPMIT